jgi:hypothetical protein
MHSCVSSPTLKDAPATLVRQIPSASLWLATDMGGGPRLGLGLVSRYVGTSAKARGSTHLAPVDPRHQPAKFRAAVAKVEFECWFSAAVGHDFDNRIMAEGALSVALRHSTRARVTRA